MQTGIGDPFSGNSSPVSNDGSLSWHWRQREGQKQNGSQWWETGGGGEGRGVHMPSWGETVTWSFWTRALFRNLLGSLALLFQYEWRDEFQKIIHINMKTTFQQSLNIPFTVEGNKAFKEKKTKQNPQFLKAELTVELRWEKFLIGVEIKKYILHGWALQTVNAKLYLRNSLQSSCENWVGDEFWLCLRESLVYLLNDGERDGKDGESRSYRILQIWRKEDQS